MEELIRRRCLTIARYMIAHESTVRQAAQVFGISKSSVHKDVGSRLAQIDADLHAETSALLARNKAVCHLRGGEATRRRYAAKKACQLPTDAV